jgi:YD repeat-containing protein
MFARPRQNYFRRQGWKDFIFLAIVCTLAIGVSRLSQFRSDSGKWKARPELGPAGPPGRSGAIPCFFTVPAMASGQPVSPGSIGDCLMLTPNGKRLELFEVDLWTGEFVPIKTDLFVSGTIPLAFTRVNPPADDWSRRFRIFFRHVYDPYLFMDRFPYTHLQWLMPDNAHVNYRRISKGTGYSDAVYECDAALPGFTHSRVSWNGDGWDVALEDGTTYLSPEAYSAKRPQEGSLVGIFDDTGHEIQLSRRANGDLTEIKSPSGGWIRLAYAQDKIVETKDSLGNVVEYRYDVQDRLQTVEYPDKRSLMYAYDSSNRIINVLDVHGNSILKVLYDSTGRVIEQTLPSGSTYSFRYGLMQNGMNPWVEISGPQMDTTRVTLDGSGYSIGKTHDRQVSRPD